MKALASILLVPLATLVAHENNGRGTKPIAMANAFVALADNAWSVSYNPAGLAQIVSPEVSTFYIPQQFGVPELKTISCSGSFRVHPGTVGALVEQFGFDLYRTTEVAVGYGCSIDSGFSIGAALDLETISIDRYGAAHDLTLDLGLLGHPWNTISIGFCAKNLTASKIGPQQERLPQSLLFGVCYSPICSFRITAEMEKDVRFPLVIKTGVEETFFDFLSLRCGIANNPDKFCAGLAIRYSEFEFGYAGYSHPDLGWTHQIELTIR